MNNSIPTSLLEIHETLKPGFQPLIDSDCWRIAFLMFAPDVTPRHIVEFQRHNESDEVFVLLSGRCILFLGEGDDSVAQIFAQNLELFKLYKVQRRVWHMHALSADAKMLIVENRNTSHLNSPRIGITPEQHAEILRLANLIWGNA
jgi:hypothetical protein